MSDHDRPADSPFDRPADAAGHDATPPTERGASFERTTIRSLADGELTEAEAAAATAGTVDREALERGVAFERELRAAVGRTMGRVAAPAGLLEQVRAAMAADADAGAAPSGGAAARAAGGDRAGGVLARLLHGPRQADWLAVAAVVMLVAAVIAFSILAPSVDDFGGGGGGAPGTPLVVNEAADFAARRHVECGDENTRAERFGDHAMDPDGAARVLADRLEVATDRFAIPDLTHLNYEFRGLAACEVPGCGGGSCASKGPCHLLYRRGDGALMSVFVVRNGDRYGAGRQDCVCEDRGKRVVKVEQGGLAWFFVCCIERDLDRAANDFLAAVDRL